MFLVVAWSVATAMAVAASPPLVMKILVLTASTDEISYQSITTFMRQIGVPYDAVVLETTLPDSAGNRLSGLSLSDSATGRGLYQGIIQTDGSFGVCDPSCHSRLSDADWLKLNNYASQFKVRVVSYYTGPEEKWGLLPADSGASYTEANPLNVRLTTAGAAVFPYLNPNNAIPVSGQYGSGIWVYRATPTAAANETTTPILTAGSYAVGVTHTTADGRETMALTMDNYPTLLHSLAFGYGVINWVTRGVFLGSRRVYLNPQVDDVLFGNRLYAPTRPECPGANTCPTDFATGQDIQALANWQTSVRADSQFQTFRTTLSYNGVGTTWFPPDDPVFQAIASLGSQFWWVSHTWDHADLDCYTTANGVCKPATLSQSLAELNQNIAVANTLGITLDTTNMVTPFNGGLTNPNFLQAAVQAGVKNIVYVGNPANPNTGLVNPINSAIFEIPRRNPDLFADVSSPQPGAYGSWPDEYNSKYGPQGSDSIYSQDQTYSQVLAHESDALLRNSMLAYEPYPLAFHVGNMSAYDGTHSLFSDLLDATIAKYKSLVTLPVMTLSMGDIAPLLVNRASYNASGVVGVYTPGVSVVLTTVKGATIPVTGACSQSTCSIYGGQLQDNVSMAANSTVTLSLSAAQGVTPVSVLLSPASVTGGSPSTATVIMSEPAPAGGISVPLSSNSSFAAVPSSVMVAAGSTTGSFTVTTTAVASSLSAAITATYNGASAAGPLTIMPGGGGTSFTLSLTPPSVTGGSSATGTVTLSAPAPAGGITVALSSSSSSVTVPASVVVPAGMSSATFTVTTSPIAITATYNGTTTSTTIGVSR